MKQRIFTAVIALAGLLLVLFAIPAEVAQAIMFAAMVAGAWEWSAFLGASGRTTRILYLLLIAAALAAVTFLAVDTQVVFKLSLVWWLSALIWTFFFHSP